MKTVPRSLNTFGFVERERVDGVKVRNKCGRDFCYYALHYHFPDTFSPQKINPMELDKKHAFGYPVPAALAWTQIQFWSVAKYLKSLGLELSINGRSVTSFFAFLTATLYARTNFDAALKRVESCIDQEIACGIDVSMGYGGLLDHVMFVYGYDEENLYVCDTHLLKGLEYEKLTSDNRYFLKLPKSIIRRRWSRFGRVWVVRKLSSVQV